MGFDHFRASAGHELAHVDLKALELRRFQSDVSLLDVAEEAWSGAQLSRVDNVKRASKAQVHLKAHRVRSVGHTEFGHVQAELVGLHVKVVQLIELRGGMIRVEGIVSIHQSAEINRANGPSRRRSGSRVLLRPEPDPPQQREPLKSHRVLPIPTNAFPADRSYPARCAREYLPSSAQFQCPCLAPWRCFPAEMLKRMRIPRLGFLEAYYLLAAPRK